MVRTRLALLLGVAALVGLMAVVLRKHTAQKEARPAAVPEASAPAARGKGEAPAAMGERRAASQDPFNAARAGDVPEIRQYLMGGDPDLKDGWGTPLLYAAATHWQIDVARELLEAGAAANAANAQGETALHHVAGAYPTPGNFPRVPRLEEAVAFTKLLLEHGADPNTRNAQGMTPLHCAAGTALMEEVGRARRNGADLPVMRVRGLGSIASLLVEHGADISARDKKGRIPLTFAMETASQHRLEDGSSVAAVLRGHGAKG